MVRTAWWWERLASEVIRGTIYLSTLNWADKEFFLTFLYIASLGQTWQNSSNINPRIGLRALISSIRSNINPRIGFELLSETQSYGQARLMQEIWSNESERNDWLSRRRETTSHLLMKTAMQKTRNMHARTVKSIAEYWWRESYYNDEIQIILINRSETFDMLTIEMKCLTFWNDEREWDCSCEYIIVSRSRIFIIICLQQFKLQSFSNYQSWLKWKYDTTRYCDFFNNREYNRTFC